MTKEQKQLVCAARAANTTPERFARSVRNLLSVRRCRDTKRRRIFTAEVLDAISHA